MKLNKVLALALSGVMAVSMLAGCKGNTPDNGGQGEQEVVTGAAAVLNDEQDVIDFTSASSTDLEKATSVLTSVTTNPSLAALDPTTDDVMKVLASLGVDDLTNDWNPIKEYQDTSDSMTAVAVFANKGTEKSMNADLKKLADDISTTFKKEVISGNKLYTYSYTGSVCAVTATNLTGTESANYIMVTITKTVAERTVG